MRTTNVSIAAVFLCYLTFDIAFAATPPEDAVASPFEAWNESELVFTGELQRVQAGPVGLSFPPVHTHQLHFEVEQVLRGDLKPAAEIVASHVVRQKDPPTYPDGKVCLVAAAIVRGKIRVLHLEAASVEKLMDVQLACSLPLGWKVVDGKPVSPWASFDKRAWPRELDVTGNLVCSVTGRPALFNGSDIDLKVEKIPPPKEIKWTNPDGDGEYKITVTNTSDKPQLVKSLLTDGKKILWDECVVILCQGRAYPCPGANGVSPKAEPVQLDAGQSVSGVVNALRLEGPEWPRGGYRIEFQFCLDEASQTQSFYYLSRHHDKIRQSLKTKAENSESD